MSFPCVIGVFLLFSKAYHGLDRTSLRAFWLLVIMRIFSFLSFSLLPTPLILLVERASVVSVQAAIMQHGAAKVLFLGALIFYSRIHTLARRWKEF